MSSTAVGYLPGDAWLVAGSSVLVSLAGPAQESALALWPLVRDGAPAADVVAAVTASRPAAWVVVSVEPGLARVLVRGEPGVTVIGADGTREVVTGSGLITWAERVFPHAVEVEIGEPLVSGDAAVALLPVPAGVVRAGFARWSLAAGAEPARPAAGAPAPGAPETAAPDPMEPPPATPASERGDPTTAGAHPIPTREHAVEPEPDIRPEPDVELEPEGEPAPEPDDTAGDDAVTVIAMVPRHAAPAVSGPPTLTPEAESVVSAVLPEQGAHRADVTQSVPLDEELDPRGADRAVGPTIGASGDAAPPDAAPDLAPETTATTAPTSGRPAGQPTGNVLLGDHDGITMLAEDLPAGFVPPRLPPEPPPGWVYASMCPSGHANQPHAGNCRICGQPIPPADPVATPRPLLGRVRLSTGTVVDLDRRVVIGRSPTVTRVSSSELPRLVTVPSPLQDVSRSHVEIRADDWHLVVADLHSTNGTVVRAPDRPEQLLHPGQELVVEPGWVVDLGDGITFVIETAG